MRSGTNRFSVESGCVAASNGGVLGAEGAGGEGWALGGLCGGVVTTEMASVPGRYDVGSYTVDCGLLALLINLSSTSIVWHHHQSSHT